jgi:hypothetical protein
MLYYTHPSSNNILLSNTMANMDLDIEVSQLFGSQQMDSLLIYLKQDLL